MILLFLGCWVLMSASLLVSTGICVALFVYISKKNITMVVATMAAAVAASLPVPQTTSAPAAPLYEAIPASMSKVIDVEAEIPLSVVQLDGLVVTKITKHACEAGASGSGGGAHGLLLGLDLDGVLEVSNSFPLVTSHGSTDDDKSSKSLGKV
jgi:translation initiation factor 3 subunit H